MTTYKELFGKYVQNVASDPTSTDAEGQIWYNTTSGTFKTALGSYAVWSSGGNLPATNCNGMSSGTQTAALLAGGQTTVKVGTTRTYNGSAWTNVPATLNTARSQASQLGGTGTQTAALVAFGSVSNPYEIVSESYNGTSWTNTSSGNSPRTGLGGSGTQTAALAFGGLQPFSGTYNGSAATESFNGTSWTSLASMNTGRFSVTGTGTQTASLVIGGGVGPTGSVTSNKTESWNGSAWSNVNNLNSARYGLGSIGTQPAAVAFGGSTTGSNVVGSTEVWNGTSWTTSPASLATSRSNTIGTGSNLSGLAIGGTDAPGTSLTATEAWTQSVVVPVAGSWSSGGNLPVGISETTGVGTQTAALTIGYEVPTITGNVFSYNGTSWSPSPALNTARYGVGAAGSQTAALAFGGSPTTGATESWNGSSWTSSPNSLNTSRFLLFGTGTQTAALAAGGRTGPAPGTTNTESYNGTIWSSVNSLNTARSNAGSAGIQTAALIFAGSDGSTTYLSNVESWNGTSWTSLPASMNTARRMASGPVGTQTATLAFGGYNPSFPSGVTGATESYNGTSWTTMNSLANARSSHGGAGTNTAGLAIGGYAGSPTYLSATEEWTGPSTTLNYKTLTTS